MHVDGGSPQRTSGLTAIELTQVGLVVHPRRVLDPVLEELVAWASAQEVRVGQIVVEGQSRRVAEPVEAAACELLISLGGDGTTLAALHEGAPSGCPVLGVACGSVGALTATHADRLAWGLREIEAGRWTRVGVPALEITWEGDDPQSAINDLVAVRDGPGQVIVSVGVDGVEYASVAGDGLVVATALGSSAYTMAAGGPLLAPGAEGMVLTPLADHGGSTPPLVTGAGSRVDLEVEPGYGGVRYEVDGHRAPTVGHRLSVTHREAYATLASLEGQEPRLTGLRRRGLVVDGPRAKIRDAREAALSAPSAPPVPRR